MSLVKMEKSRSAIVLLILAIAVTGGRSLTCTNFTNIGETKQLDVSASSSFQFVCIQLNNTLEPIRVSIKSENATSRHPLLVTARQPMGVVSWTLPYVESGYSYSSIEQTLCPMLNRDDTGSAVLIIDFSTTQSTPLSVSLNTTLVTPFRLEMNTPVTLEASPSGPSYLLYEYGDLPPDRNVRVNFLSMDNTSDICAIASVQTSFCPVVNLLDNAGNRGRFQTMRSIASITTKENNTEPHFGYIYVVLNVLPNDGVDNSCLETKKGLGDSLVLFDNAEDNFNPTVYSGPERTKRVVITVKLVDPNLAAAFAVPIVVYLFFVAFAIIWIMGTLYRSQKKKKSYSVNQKDQPNNINLQDQPGSVEPQEGVKTNDHEGTAQSNGNNTSNGDAEANQDPQQAIQRSKDKVNAQETSDCEYAKFRININMAELGKIDDSPKVQKEYTHYSIYLLVIIAFYSIPAYQLVVTYQKLLFSSGNEDICYYNSLCAQPLDTTDLTLSAFNNIFSNIGYVILGALYIGVACIRRRRYRKQEKTNDSDEIQHDQKKGVPQVFGIYYALGLAMIGQAFMSVAYHLCPSITNYQFDATFMYVMAVLGLFKVLTTRAPDLSPALHRHACFLMVIIIVVVLGGVWFQYLAFKIVFFLVYLATALIFSLEVYYRWQIKLHPRSIEKLYKLYRKERPCPPQYWLKFVVVIIALLLNTVIAIGIFLTEINNVDFARYFLLVVLSNFLIYLIYYLVAKFIHKECFTVKVYKPVVYTILAFCMWVVSIYFFTQNVTDTSVSPALSRDGNKECLAFGFYDSHDLWHFASSFALFFSFAILLALDEGQEDKLRSEIKTF